MRPFRLPTNMRQTLLLLVLTVLVPLLVVQAGIYIAWYYSQLQSQEAVTSEIAQEAARTFEEFGRDVYRQQSAIGAALTGSKPYTTEQANTFLTAAGKSYPSIHRWSWTTSEGKIIASTQSKAIGSSIADQDYFRELRGGRPWIVSNLLTEEGSGNRVFAIASRIDDAKGSMSGAVIAATNVTDLKELIATLLRPVGEAIALFDRTGIMIYNSQEPKGLFQDWRNKDPLLAGVLRNGVSARGVFHLADNGEASETCIAARVPIKDIGWVAGARRPVAAAMANVYTGLWIASGLNLLVAVVSSLVAMKTSDVLIRQLRGLQEHAQAIGRSDFEHLAEIAGIRELAELATAFNQMGAAVRTTLEAQERLASFPTLNPNPITEVDVDGHVHYLNPTAERLFPNLRETGLAHPWLVDWESVASAATAGQDHGNMREVNVEDRWYQQAVHYVKSMRRIRLYGLDITDRKRAEDVLKQTAEQLARSNEELVQFAYVASHDLQEPLRIVGGYVQLIERKYKNKLDVDANEFLHYIVDGVTRMQQLITDLLNYSRVGTRGLPLRAMHMQAALDRALANLQNTIEENNATITHDSLPDVRADETQMVQLFQNLIGNGIKFRGDEPPQIHVSAHHDGNCWVFAVRDNGIGIEQQYWEQIFAIFQRLHTRKRYAGTGIGLAICKRIVDRHGGRIWLDSQPGQGATFYFTIP